MKMRLKDNVLIVVEADSVQFTIIKSWNKMRWNKKRQQLEGTADMELLDKLSSIVHLPPSIEQYRANLHRVQDAVDQERVNPDPKPVYTYPVKMPLYQHQTRAANMCLLTFGLISPDGGTVNE